MARTISLALIVVTLFANSAAAQGRPTQSPRQRFDLALCVPSERYPGYFYLRQKSDGEKLGNYFSSLANCAASRDAEQAGYYCMESAKYEGYAYIYSTTRFQRVGDQNDAMVGKYISGFQSCVAILQNSSGGFACSASSEYPGYWYIANLEENTRFGGYFSSYTACFAGVR